jgi:PAT family beta-lactamase induction signal transducer AmpG
MALFAVLGFSAGLPFYLFATVLFLRLARHGVDLTIIGFFGWVSLLPTFKLPGRRCWTVSPPPASPASGG